MAAAAAAAAGTAGKFWVFKFAVIANGTRIFEFDETAASATEKHGKIAAAGVSPPSLPPLASLQDEAAGAAAGAALAAYYAELFATPAAKASQPVRELFEPRSDAPVPAPPYTASLSLSLSLSLSSPSLSVCVCARARVFDP